jgi:NAD(P)H-hydrate repair Nnr-like enzyme with NAD(P)H-hydrate epimerase domain
VELDAVEAALGVLDDGALGVLGRGDGLEAAALLAAQGLRVSVTWLGNDARLPADARASLTRARAAKVQFVELDALETVESVARVPAPFDLVIDALFGLGQARPLEGAAAQAVAHLNAARAAGLGVVTP